MADRKTTFALFFGNRGFFPASLIAEAREELPRVLEAWGHDVLMLDEEATRYGAVETPREGERDTPISCGKTGANSVASSSAFPTSETRPVPWRRYKRRMCRSSYRRTLMT